MPNCEFCQRLVARRANLRKRLPLSRQLMAQVDAKWKAMGCSACIEHLKTKLALAQAPAVPQGKPDQRQLARVLAQAPQVPQTKPGHTKDDGCKVCHTAYKILRKWRLHELTPPQLQKVLASCETCLANTGGLTHRIVRDRVKKILHNK